MITLPDWILQLIGLVLGGGLLANVFAGIKNKNDDKQQIIDQLQEERKWTADQLRERDGKIDELYNLYRELEKNYSALAQEKREVDWELQKKIKENNQLIEENNELQQRITELEDRVEELEKERKHGNIN